MTCREHTFRWNRLEPIHDTFRIRFNPVDVGLNFKMYCLNKIGREWNLEKPDELWKLREWKIVKKKTFNRFCGFVKKSNTCLWALREVILSDTVLIKSDNTDEFLYLVYPIENKKWNQLLKKIKNKNELR